MAEFGLPLASWTLALTLGGAGALHALRPAALASALATHGWPAASRRPVAWTVIALEGGLGGAGVWLAGREPAGADGLLPAAFGVLFVLFGVYTLMLLRRRPGVPCGCGLGGPVSRVVVGRAFLLAAVAAVLVGARDTANSIELTGWQAAVVIEAAIAFSLLLLLLPEARGAP